MIQGFEEQTFELTKIEIGYARTLAKALILQYNSAKGVFINNKKIADIIYKIEGERPSPARIRKIIQWLRINQHPTGYVIVSSSKGYKLSSDKQEIEQLIDSLNARANAIRNVAYNCSRALISIANG